MLNTLIMIAWQRAFKVGDGLVMISSTATRGNSEKCSSLLQWLQERAISGPRSHLGQKIFTEVVSADIKEEICQLAGSNNILIALSKTLLNRCRVNIKVKYEHEKRLPCHWSCMVVNFSNNTQCIAMPRWSNAAKSLWDNVTWSLLQVTFTWWWFIFFWWNLTKSAATYAILP